MRISDWSSDVCSSDLTRVIGFAQIMAVEIFELFEVEARRRAADMSEVEPFGRLRAADDFVVAMPPAEAEAIIVHRLGQIAHLVAIGVDAERAVKLRWFRAVGAVAQRDMPIGRASCRE